GALLTASLGFLLGSLIDQSKLSRDPPDPALRWWLYASLVCFLGSAMLYLATVYAYDRLLMPKRFWGERARPPHRRPRWLVWRPPSSAVWGLYQTMIRVWHRMFLPATFGVTAGLACLALAVVHAEQRPYAVGVILSLAGAFALYYWRFSPRLGSED